MINNSICRGGICETDTLQLQETWCGKVVVLNAQHWKLLVVVLLVIELLVVELLGMPLLAMPLLVLSCCGHWTMYCRQWS